MIDDPDFNARWDRDMKARPAGISADEILRDLEGLQRAWAAYQRRFRGAPSGQLELFTERTMTPDRRETITVKPDAAVEGGAGSNSHLGGNPR